MSKKNGRGNRVAFDSTKDKTHALMTHRWNAYMNALSHSNNPDVIEKRWKKYVEARRMLDGGR